MMCSPDGDMIQADQVSHLSHRRRRFSASVCFLQPQLPDRLCQPAMGARHLATPAGRAVVPALPPPPHALTPFGNHCHASLHHPPTTAAITTTATAAAAADSAAADPNPNPDPTTPFDCCHPC